MTEPAPKLYIFLDFSAISSGTSSSSDCRGRFGSLFLAKLVMIGSSSIRFARSPIRQQIQFIC